MMEFEARKSALHAVVVRCFEDWKRQYGGFDVEEAAKLFMYFVRPCVEITCSETPGSGELPPGSTKWGGGADLPEGRRPPLVEKEDTWLVCQINLADLPPGPWASMGRRGMLYLYARGKPRIKPGDHRRPLHFFLDLWKPDRDSPAEPRREEKIFRHSFPGGSRLDGNGTVVPGSLLESVPETQLLLAPAILLPQYGTMSTLAYDPPAHLEPLSTALYEHFDNPDSPLGDPSVFGYCGILIINACREAGIPVCVRPDLMFGDPDSFEDSGIRPPEWFEGRICQVFKLSFDLMKWANRAGEHGYTWGESYPIFDMLGSVEVYARRTEDGELDLGQQWSLPRWH